MRSRDITLWLDERWYDALSKYLKGETLEEHLQNTIDEMCRQLPGQEYDRINEEIQQEQKDDQIAQEAARRFAVFHVTEGSSSTYFLTEERLEFLQTARQLRNYIRKADGDAPAHFAEMFPRRENLSRKQFQKYVSERLDNTGRVVDAFDIDLDNGHIDALNIMDGWKRFRIQDVSSAVYFAMKKIIATPDDRWRTFLDRLQRRSHTKPSRSISPAVGLSVQRTSPSPRTLFSVTTCWSSTWKYRSMRTRCSEPMSAPQRMMTG